MEYFRELALNSAKLEIPYMVYLNNVEAFLKGEAL